MNYLSNFVNPFLFQSFLFFQVVFGEKGMEEEDIYPVVQTPVKRKSSSSQLNLTQFSKKLKNELTNSKSEENNPKQEITETTPIFNAISLNELLEKYGKEKLQEANVLPIHYQDLILDVLTPEQIARFEEDGVLVVPNILTKQQCKIVEEGLINAINVSLLKEEEFKLSTKNYSTFEILTQPKVRKEKLKEPDLLYSSEKTYRKRLEIGNSGMTVRITFGKSDN